MPLGERGGKAVVAHHIPGKAGGAAKADEVRLFAGVPGIQQRRAVGHLDHIRGVAGRRHVQNGKARLAILQSIQHSGNKIPGVQRPCFARLQIHLHAVLFLCFGNALFQRGKAVAGAGDMVPAAKVEPLHPGQKIPELCFHRRQRQGQCIGILLAQGVEVQSVQ